MRQYKIAIGALAAISCLITIFLYYWHEPSRTDLYKILLDGEEDSAPPVTPLPIVRTFQNIAKPFRHVALDEVYRDGNKNDMSVEVRYLRAMYINTPGCRIPLSLLKFRNEKEKRKKAGTCGSRAVFLNKLSGNEIKASIKEKILKKYLRKRIIFECCYRFIMQSTRAGEENRKIRYTKCIKFQDGSTITLESDFVNIKCFEQRKNTSHEVYDDVYAFIKMINETKKPNKPCKSKFNVILLGMDSMSLSRFFQVMDRTTTFFRENYWLAYRAFHKIGDNTLPNLMATITGHNMSTISKKCSRNMDKCKKMLIWSKFEEEGYVTAYGEDHLRLPDTFQGDYRFLEPPTHHYLRPLYVKGETELFNKSLVCAGKMPSAQHLLDYVFDFALTYRSQSFFGLFWINSYSHNENSRPEHFDHKLENFLNRLTYTGILDNTFIIFFSDHGVRFGKHRLQIESYYDERLPVLFLWTPNKFQGYYTSFFKSLAMNEHLLVTPYDLYNTLIDIHRLSTCENMSPNNTEIASVAEGCPKCHSLFHKISDKRTCEDAAIDNKWCGCHSVSPLYVGDSEAKKSIQLLVSYIANMSKSAKAKRCWRCKPLELKNVIRIHFYYDNAKVHMYHIVALTMTPGNMSYEGVILRRGRTAELLGSLSVISTYRGHGRCTVNTKDRVFCVCQKIDHC